MKYLSENLKTRRDNFESFLIERMQKRDVEVFEMRL